MLRRATQAMMSRYVRCCSALASNLLPSLFPSDVLFLLPRLRATFAASASIGLLSFYPYCNPLRPGFQKIHGQGPKHLATIPLPDGIPRARLWAVSRCLSGKPVFLFFFYLSLVVRTELLPFKGHFSHSWQMDLKPGCSSTPYFSRGGRNNEGCKWEAVCFPTATRTRHHMPTSPLPLVSPSRPSR